MKHRRLSLNQVLQALVGFYIVLVLIIIIWGLNKGFDAYDEGFYLIYALPGQENVNHTFWWIYIRFLFGTNESSVIASRVARLVMTLVSNGVFSFGFWQWFKTHRRKDRDLWPDGLVFLFTFFGGLVCFIHGPLSYSYNHMNSHFLLMASGCFLFLLSRNPLNVQSKALPDLLWILIGSLIGFQFFVKYPSAVLVISFFTLIMLFSNPQDDKRNIFMKVGGFGLGFLVSVLVSIYMMGGIRLIRDYLAQIPSFGTPLTRHTPVFLLFLSYYEFFNEMKYIFVYYLPFYVSTYLLILHVKKGGEKITALLVSILLSIYFIYVTFQTAQHTPYPTFQITNLLFLSIVLLVFYQKPSRHRIGRVLLPKLCWWKIPVLLACGLLIIYLITRLMAYQDPWLVTMHKFIFAVLVPLALAGIVLYPQKVWQAFLAIFRNEKYLVTTFLVLMPFIGSFGTNTGLVEKSIDNLALWFAVMIILLHDFSRIETIPYKTRKISLSAFIAFVVTISSVQIVYGYILHPYHLRENLLSQKFEVANSKRLAGLKLDRETARFYETLITTLNEKTDFEYRDPVIGLFDIPGLVYAIGGLSPGKADFPHVADLEATCYTISQTKMGDLDRVIIFSTFELNTENAACFQELGMDIAHQYENVAVIHIPFDYLNRSGEDKLYIYARR